MSTPSGALGFYMRKLGYDEKIKIELKDTFFHFITIKNI